MSTKSAAQEFEQANVEHVRNFKEPPAIPSPIRKVAIITCMDARLDVFKMCGLKEGDAHVIRNGGGRAADAMRSLVISQQNLGTREVVIIHHTDCGFSQFDDATVQEKLRKEFGVNDGDSWKFLPFTDLDASVREDVKYIRDSKLTLDVPVTGYVYDCQTGKLKKVA